MPKQLCSHIIADRRFFLDPLDDLVPLLRYDPGHGVHLLHVEGAVGVVDGRVEAHHAHARLRLRLYKRDGGLVLKAMVKYE